MIHTEYIAHRISESEKTQTLLAHLTAMANLSAGFASAFGAAEAAYRCGLLHDAGKYSARFQARIRGATIRVDHSTAGAVDCAGPRDIAAALCIAGHHGGLPDLGAEPTLPRVVPCSAGSSAASEPRSRTILPAAVSFLYRRLCRPRR